MSASAAAPAAKKGGSGGQSAFAVLQRIGKSLMLPISVLPAAGLLLRLGQGDLLGGIGETAPNLGDGPFSILSKAGDALFGNLALLFALGVAIGFAKKSDGSTALAGLVGYLVFKNVLTFSGFDTAEKFDPSSPAPPDPGVFGGIVMGITAALLWAKYHRTKLPAALAFFSGRRLVPMMTALAGIIWGIAFGFVWPPIGDALNAMAEWMYANGPLGAGVYGVINRLLIPTGLHHIINSFVWFQAGSCPTAIPDTPVMHGDLNCFFNATEDHHKYGLFMTGFFPIFMFALPAAAFAMVSEAKDKVAASVLPAAALTSFLTGVTEPIEFSFMFAAPLLYGVHALMTGVSMALTYGLGVRDGFGFSAGFMDYALNWGIATKPIFIIPIGVAFGAVYYFLFRLLIRKFDLKTPGREDFDAAEDEAMIAP